MAQGTKVKYSSPLLCLGTVFLCAQTWFVATPPEDCVPARSGKEHLFKQAWAQHVMVVFTLNELDFQVKRAQAHAEGPLVGKHY